MVKICKNAPLTGYSRNSDRVSTLDSKTEHGIEQYRKNDLQCYWLRRFWKNTTENPTERLICSKPYATNRRLRDVTVASE